MPAHRAPPRHKRVTGPQPVVLTPDSRRCFWVRDADPDYVAYHDTEWGWPVDDDRRLFEKLALEGFQSGLSWLTILRKRDAFRRAFANFDVQQIARFGPDDVERLMADEGIVRHRGKIEATIHNAIRTAMLLDEFGSLAAYVWRFEPTMDERPAQFDEATLRAMTTSPSATALAADLKKRGWKFVGPTTVYAFMQSMGLVNDHTEDCAVRHAVAGARLRFTPPHAR